MNAFTRSRASILVLALGCSAPTADKDTTTAAGEEGADTSAGATSVAETGSADTRDATSGTADASDTVDASDTAACEMCGSNACIDLDRDPSFCGACDVQCPALASCTDGACVCDDGLTMCAGGCVNTLANPIHCGGCDDACDAGLLCNVGACADGCNEGLLECDGGCVDPNADASNCGGCGQSCGGSQTCSAGACSCAGGPVSYDTDIEPILVAECTSAGCHRPPALAAALDLTAGNGYAAMIDVASTCANRAIVAPGAPEDSYLMAKLLGQNMCSGSQMPKGGQELPQAQVDAVESWICGGALP